jgi:hypothetical protein
MNEKAVIKIRIVDGIWTNFREITQNISPDAGDFDNQMFK